MSNGTPEDREYGRVKWFNGMKGYGFITRDSGAGDVFVHVNDTMDRFPLEEGQRVSFEIVHSPRGPKAKEVREAEEDESSTHGTGGPPEPDEADTPDAEPDNGGPAPDYDDPTHEPEGG